MNKALDKLATDLFRTFARFEYALKAVGFHQAKRNGDAEANWRSFAESVSDLFDDPRDPALREAIAFMLGHPPKKQVIAGGGISWSESEPGTNLQSDRVLIYVRRVRNNLFHGGKFNGRWFEPQRSEQLLKSSLIILRACLDASEDLKNAYDG